MVDVLRGRACTGSECKPNCKAILLFGRYGAKIGTMKCFFLALKLPFKTVFRAGSETRGKGAGPCFRCFA